MNKILCKLIPLFILSLLLTACGKAEIPELLEPTKVDTDIETVSCGEIFNISMYEATVTPEVLTHSFETSGTVSRLNVTVGDVVKKGDVLGTIDMSEVQSQRDRLAKELETAIANQEFDLRRMELEKSIALSSGDSSAAELKELDIQESQELFAIEKQEKENMIAELDTALANQSLKAACSGTVIKMTVNPGDEVKAGDGAIYVADDSTMVVTTEFISEEDINDCDRVYASIGGKEYDVEYIAYERSEYLQLVLSGAEITSSFDIISPDDSIENGMFTCVYLVTDYLEDVLKLPANAVHKDAGGYYVYLVEDDEQVKQYIETGVETPAEIQIISGLQEGDAVYVAS